MQLKISILYLLQKNNTIYQINLFRHSMEGKKKILLIIASIGTLLLVVPIIGLILFQAIGEHSYTNTTESIPSFYSGEKSFAPNGSDGKGTSRGLNDSPSDQTKIIKTGNINKRVDNFSESEEKIRKISSENNYSDRKSVV